MDYFQLKKEIESKKIKNAYAFVGTEIYLKRAAVDMLFDTFIPEEVQQLNISIIEDETNTKTIMDMCETLPFLAEKRIILIKDINYIKDDAAGIKAFFEYVSKGNDACCIVILAIDIPKQYSQITKTVCVIDFKPLEDSILIKWLIETAKKENITLKKDSAELLLLYCLNDMTTLKNELDKLIEYSKDKGCVVEKNDVEKIVTKSIQYNVFKMLDFFEQDKFDSAYEMYEQIKQEGGQAFAILGAIASRYRNIYYAKSLIEKGHKGETLKKELGLNYYAAQSALNSVKNYSISQLNYIFELLNYTDYSIKNGRIKESEAIDNMLLNLFNNSNILAKK